MQPDVRSTSHFGRVNENVAWTLAERGGGSFDNNVCAQSVAGISRAQWPSLFDLGVPAYLPGGRDGSRAHLRIDNVGHCLGFLTEVAWGKSS